MDATSKHPLHR